MHAVMTHHHAGAVVVGLVGKGVIGEAIDPAGKSPVTLVLEAAGVIFPALGLAAGESFGADHRAAHDVADGGRFRHAESGVEAYVPELPHGHVGDRAQIEVVAGVQVVGLDG